jgi:hypothetical protein
LFVDDENVHMAQIESWKNKNIERFYTKMTQKVGFSKLCVKIKKDVISTYSIIQHKQRRISFILGYLRMILWNISTAISIKHPILTTFNIKKNSILTDCMPLKRGKRLSMCEIVCWWIKCAHGTNRIVGEQKHCLLLTTLELTWLYFFLEKNQTWSSLF